VRAGARLRLDRRALIRGAGSIAIALPWLEVMGTRRAQAAAPAGPARRFVGVFQPGGTVRARYTPTGTETDFTMGAILRPLEPLKERLLVIDGLDMKSAVGEQHQAGIVALLTGTPQRDGGAGYAGGPSIDQVIATRISAGKKPKASLQMAVRWATGKSKGRLHPINALNYEDNGTFNPIPPRLDPAQIFEDLFGSARPGGGGGGDGGGAADGRVARRRSILDHVGRRYETLAGRLGAADRRKLEQHLTKLRELEKGLMVPGPGPGAGSMTSCRPPGKVDTSDYNPRTGLDADPDGTITDSRTDAAIPKVGKYMMDMLVTALACDLTAVATFQWSDTEAKHTLPWLGLKDHHHYYQHDGGFRAAECEQVGIWYSQQHLYLLEQLAAVDMGGHTLLDESVVFFGSEIQDPPSHGKTNLPLLLAGGGGGLRTGRWLEYGGRSHNDLLVSILNLFGDPRRTFGDPGFCAGPLPNLV
jgi:hypothetical protein